MITHIVLFEPGEGFAEADQRSVLDALAATIEACPSVRRCRVGRRIRHDVPGYEQAMRHDYQFALVLDFDDVEGLRAYLTHPRHAALGSIFSSGASALAYDYDLQDLDDARR